MPTTFCIPNTIANKVSGVGQSGNWLASSGTLAQASELYDSTGSYIYVNFAGSSGHTQTRRLNCNNWFYSEPIPDAAVIEELRVTFVADPETTISTIIPGSTNSLSDLVSMHMYDTSDPVVPDYYSSGALRYNNETLLDIAGFRNYTVTFNQALNDASVVSNFGFIKPRSIKSTEFTLSFGFSNPFGEDGQFKIARIRMEIDWTSNNKKLANWWRNHLTSGAV